MTDKPEVLEKDVKKVVKLDDRRFVLPIDIRRKRIFWALSAFFVLLMCLVVLLIILMLNMVRPPGFGAAAPNLVANFQTSFYGPADSLLSRPTGVALSPSGEVYIADTGNARVAVFDREGNLLRSITEFAHADALDEDADVDNQTQSQTDAHQSPYATPLEDSPTAFVAPTSLAFAADGRWFAVDQALRMVLFFSDNNQLIQGIHLLEEAPISVDISMVGEEEQLFVTTRSGILQASIDGAFQYAYLNWGLRSGQLDNPAAVIVFDPGRMDEEASISTTDTAVLTIVADTLNNRVQAFRNFQTDPEVAWIFSAPILDSAIQEGFEYEFENMIYGNISAPVDMALSPLGRLFVVDGLSSEVVVLDAQTGVYQYTISSVGFRDGFLFYPSGICFGAGNVYVVDRFNNRLSVFEDAPPLPVEEPTEAVTEAPNRWLLLALPLVAFAGVILRLLTLAMPRYVLDLSALEHLAEDDDALYFVIEHFDNMTIVSGTESLAEKMLPGFDWKISAAKESKRDTLIEKHPGLDDLDAEALILASKRKRRSYLLTASRSVERAGDELGLKVLRYADFRATAHTFMVEERRRLEEIDARAAEKTFKRAAKTNKKISKQDAKKVEKDSDSAEEDT